jgi:serine/threonine protein kinase
LEDALIYVMPLSDGFDGLSPHDSEWEPVTLSGLIAHHRSHDSWFSLDEVKKIIDGVIQGAGLIGEAGLQHRDIKPENVIFIEGEPALGDFGLATEDMTQVSMRGTPHHAAPSWYLESGGNSDQWGVAILFYQLLTGNSPDKMGRPKYLKPAEGMVLNGEGEKSEWNRIQSLVNRATSEVAGERFQGFEAFRKGLLSEVARPIPQSQELKFSLVIAGLFLALLGAFLLLKGGVKRPDAGVIVTQPAATPQKPQGASTPFPDEPPLILQQKDKPHVLSQQDAEQMNQYTSKRASKAAESAVNSLAKALEGLPQPVKKGNP